jgi:xanthine dehydrogenase accessory factor
VKVDVLTELRAARAARRPVVLATWIDGGAQLLLTPRSSHPLAEAAARALARDQADVVDSDRGPVFLEPHNPPRRLLLVGAVHIAQPLAAMGGLAGFAVTVVDPRTAFATEARFPGVPLVTRWPDEALAELAPDARTAVVTLTHDPKLDDPALLAALASPAFYVGCLGSRKTHAGRLARLREAGVAAEQLERLRGPVGLRIGAASPAEIAVSILAEVIAALRGALAAADQPGREAST